MPRQTDVSRKEKERQTNKGANKMDKNWNQQKFRGTQRKRSQKCCLKKTSERVIQYNGSWRLGSRFQEEMPVVPAIRCEVFSDTWHFEGPSPSYHCDPLHLQLGQMGYSQHNRQQLNKQHTWGGSPPIPDCQSGFGAFLKHH